MSERRRIPDLPRSVLRDNATDDGMERVWRRLEAEVRGPRRERAPLLWWVPAGAAALFACGVFVGMRIAETTPSPVVEAEDRAPRVLSPAAQTPHEPEAAREPARPRQVAQPVRRTARAGRVAAPSTSAAPLESALPPEVAAPAALPVVSPPWQTFAAQLDYDAASAALSEQGGFDAALVQASPEQLMTLHDIARATGDRVNALEALRRVVALHPSDPNAPVAAWSLGNLLESSGDRVGAEQAYSAYRALSPQGDFAEDALARQVEIVREQGDLVRARQMARQYVQEFSNGRHIEEMQQLAGAAVDELPGAGGASPPAQELPAPPPLGSEELPQ